MGGELWHAASEGDEEKVKVLLAEGADVNYPSSDGTTPLIAAAEKGSAEVVRLLLSHGAEVNKADASGWTALNGAAQTGSLDVVRVLVAGGADVDAADCDGTTPLITSCPYSPDIARYLIEHGADVNKGGGGMTPLMAARDAELVELLLERGVKVRNVADVGTLTVGKVGVLLRDPPEDFTPYLVKAILTDSTDVVELLLRHGPPSPDSPSIAASRGSYNSLRLVLQHGADPNRRGAHGETALHVALGNLGCVRLLLEHGADINAVDEAGRTPLFVATERGNLSAVEALLEAGADPNIPDADYTTPLLMSQYIEESELQTVLMNHGAEL